MVESRAKNIIGEMEKSREKELMDKEARLTMLQSQINPHFLYNALESIRGEAILENSPTIEKVAEALGKYFRYNISARSNLTVLSSELENIRDYMSIQQFRFNNRFQLEIVYEKEDEPVLETILPRMTLQPLVENSIVHGFEESVAERRITISITFTGVDVRIVISDNGIGMDSTVLKRLNDKIQGKNPDEPLPSERKHNGIAVANVHKRIQMMYGEQYGLHVESILNVGTDVEILLPFCTDYKEQTDEK